jgi:hypothetical protein
LSFLTIRVNGSQQTLLNDFVWIFAGGEPPTAFLKKIGVGIAERDVTPDGTRAVKEAKEAALSFPADGLPAASCNPYSTSLA